MGQSASLTSTESPSATTGDPGSTDDVKFAAFAWRGGGTMETLPNLRWSVLAVNGAEVVKVLQQARRDMETGEIEWTDVPMVKGAGE